MYLTLSEQYVQILITRKDSYGRSYPSNRHTLRTVRDARPTGFIAKDLWGNDQPQWIGKVNYYGEVFTVWGYSNNSNPPTSWANDTF